MSDFLKAFARRSDGMLKTSGAVERSVYVAVGLVMARTLVNEGFGGVSRDLVLFLRKMPLVNSIIDMVLEGEVKGAMKLLAGSDDGGEGGETINLMEIPEKGVSPETVVKVLAKMKESETTAEDGRAFAYTYTTKADMAEFAKSLGSAYSLYTASAESNSADHETMLTKAWDMFMHSNALNPMMYPSLRRMETEVISMAGWMLHGNNNVSGALTSGGTESILMAIKCYRDLARAKKAHITEPNMVVSTTIHPAFEKAAHYFNVEIIHVEPNPVDQRMDVAATRAACNRNTILLVGSAPQYCHGVVDPIEALSELALEKDLPLHVDACFGGFMLPWMEKLGRDIPLWDFRVKGVTSISADIHKYGYSSKGASCLLYKTSQLREYQYFAYSQWPGGLFGSPSLAGSRPGGMIAAAWAALVGMGQSGYMEIARNVCTTTDKLCAGVSAIKGIRLLTKPDMTSLAIVPSDDEHAVNILAVADIMEEKMGGWKMERQQLPDSLHLSVLPQHSRTADQFLLDMQRAVNYVREHPETANQGTTGVYGMVAKVPDKGIINSFLKKFFSELYHLEKGNTILDQFK